MNIKQQPTAKLIPYVNNARTHSDEQVAQIAASIREFGFNNPVLVDKQNTIIAGHGRVMAAKLLDIDTVPTICLDHLTEDQRKAYILADNKLAMNAGWDNELLKLELGGLIENDFNVEIVGFDSEEIDYLLDDFLPSISSADEQGDLGVIDKETIICPDCGHEFVRD